MPIYEFYCHKCHTIYNFFSRTVNTETIPRCPRCKTVPLKRQMSLFSHLSGSKKEEDELPLDEAKLEQAMSILAGEAEKIDEEDPRQAAKFMRKLTEATGMSLTPAMEEALSRLEKGEDPEAIEEEMGEILENEEPFSFGPPARRGKTSRRVRPPQVDDTLYELT